MRRLNKYLVFGALTVVLWSCGFDDEPQLPSVEDRVAEATGDLQGKLTAPASGWRIDYRPNDSGGTFIILLDFNEDGTLRIRSDVTVNGGEFRDHTITYRIDSRQGLQLIMETYGLFHYFFEQQNSSFGGEFEFIFVNEIDGGGLVFRSKSDASILTFLPASASDASLLQADDLGLLATGNFFQRENIGQIGLFAPYNIYIPSDDITISLTLDLDSRRVRIHGASSGSTLEEFGTSTNRTEINELRTYTVVNGAIQPEQPITFRMGVRSYSISSIPIGNLSNPTGSFCEGETETLTRFSGTAPGLGSFQMTSSLLQTHSSFSARSGSAYGINGVFVFDGDDEPLFQQVEDVFPHPVAATQWYLGFQLQDGEELNAVGFVTLDEFNIPRFYLREYEFERVGNVFRLNFVDNFIVNDDSTGTTIDNFEALIDDIFGDGEIYMLEPATIDGLYEFINPCNGNKGFMFAPL